MLGVLELEDSFDSCITATLKNYVILLPMPFALNCMMVNEFTSTACVGIDFGSGCGFGRVGGELRELHTQYNTSVFCRVLKTRTLRMYSSRKTIA